MQQSPIPDGYFAMTDTDKVGYWVGMLYRAMRSAGEDGHEEITILDKDLLASLIAADPDVGELMSQILPQLARMWMESPDKFVARVNMQMGTAFGARWTKS